MALCTMVTNLIRIQTKDYSLEQIGKAFGDIIVEDIKTDNVPRKGEDLEGKQ